MSDTPNPLNISINPDQIKDLVSEAILAQLSSDERTNIIRQAISALHRKPKKDIYSSVEPESELERSFRLAVESVARTVTRELVEEDPEFVEQVRQAIRESMTATMNDSHKLRARVASTVADVITEGDRY